MLPLVLACEDIPVIRFLGLELSHRSHMERTVQYCTSTIYKPIQVS